MLEQAFLQILNMSFTASFVILAVLLIRLPLKRAPKSFSYGLWSIVLFRLVCPFSFESVLSLLPVRANPIPADLPLSSSPRVDTGIRIIDNAVNPILPAPEPWASANPLQIWTAIGIAIWLAGVAVLLIYSFVSLFRLHRRLCGAICEEANVYLAPNLDTPFVMGVFHPRIYLPAGLSSEERRYILLHERTHIRRLDHVFKLLSFLVLCLHWFNPLVWAAFFLSGRDMEMSCDECVLRKYGSEIKKGYSSSLLSLATGRRIVGGAPLAFGEGDTKSRIKHVLNYRRPAFWVLIAAVLGVAVACVTLIANPKSKPSLTPEETARQVAALWPQKWASLGQGMRNGEGKLFLADVTGDSVPELFLLYDDSNTSGAVVYDVSRNTVRELGGFQAGSFYNAEDLRFQLYRKGRKTVLRTESVVYSSATGSPRQITEVFAVCESGRFTVAEPPLYRIESGEGARYMSSPTDSTVITREEYERRVADILGSAQPVETIVLAQNGPIVNLLDEDELREAVCSLAANGSGSLNGVEVTAGDTEFFTQRAFLPPTEEEFLQSLLSSRTFENGAIEFTIPSVIPSGHEFRLEISALYPESPGSTGSVEAFHSRSGNPTWEAGRTYRETMFKDGVPDGTELYFDAVFLSPNPDGTSSEIVNRGSSHWIFQDGVPTEALRLSDTIVTTGRSSSAQTVTYRESDGNTFRLSLTLPDGWSLRPDEGDALTFGHPFGLVNVDANGARIATISYCNFDDPTGYATPGQENYRLAVYSQLMLGSMLNWNNDYTPVKQTDTSCTATCRIYFRNGGAGVDPVYTPGILSYDTTLLRYVAIEFTGGSATDSQLRAIAESIRLSRETSP